MLIDISKTECYQYYLLLAYYINEYCEHKEKAFNWFKLSYEKDPKSFPRIRFYEYLDHFDNTDLKIMKSSCDIKLVTIYIINITKIN
jgi:hypothetical protein